MTETKFKTTNTALPRLALVEVRSERTPVSETILLKSDKIRFDTHCFLGVRFFDAQGQPVTPGAGSIAIAVQTLNSTPVWELPEVSNVDATAPVTVDWAANTFAVRGIPTGVTTAVTWEIVITLNRH